MINPSARLRCRHVQYFNRLFCSSVFTILLQMISGGFNHVSCEDSPEKSIEHARLETMRDRIMQIQIVSNDRTIPEKMLDQPLFRYDDLTRGYIDGTVWRLGATGRPKAVITAELHPKYLGSPRIVYDYLSLTEMRFTAKMSEGAVWSPSGSAVKMEVMTKGPVLAESKAQRLLQLKKVAERFTGHQTVEGQELELRLLPRPIDRYQPTENRESDAAIFLFVSGRNPGVLLLIEASGTEWQYGIGRLSEPSVLTVELDGISVWHVDRAQLGWNLPYTATNFDIEIPGIK